MAVMPTVTPAGARRDPSMGFLQRLHKTAGNRMAGRWIQAKLTVGAPDDVYEQEADRVADQVMRMPEPNTKSNLHPMNPAPPSVQRRCACEGGAPCSSCEEEKKVLVQRRIGDGSNSAASAIPDNCFENLGTGQPMLHASRSFFESRFGHDFSGVRIHTNTAATESARALNAKAYTVGSDIVMGTGQYAPHTGDGKNLLAHELTHVVQQSGASGLASTLSAPSRTVQRKADISQLPPAMSCVTTTEPGHPAGTDLIFTPPLSTSLDLTHFPLITGFVVSWIGAGSSSDVAVDGFAGIGGTQQGNWQRSCDRAEKVKTQLVASGIPKTKITTFAHGESTEYGPASPPNERAVIHTASALPASNLRIDAAEKDGDPDTLFFDRGSATLTEPTQVSKIAPLASKNSGKNLTLFGFVSEEENVPAASGTTLTAARIAQVSAKLGGAGHSKPRTPDISQRAFGTGQIDYREFRKVIVKPAGGASGVSNCGAGSMVACSPGATFTDAQKRAGGASGLLEKVIAKLTPPIDAATNGFLDARFGTTPVNRTSVADVVKSNLTALKTHIGTQMTPVSTLGPPPDLIPSPGHLCVNSCDSLCSSGAVAYNSGQDAAATMTLCDTTGGFMKEPNLDKRAGVLIHEGLHGITIKVGPIAPAAGPPITKPGAKDFSYVDQRLINFLDPQTAIKNNDSYVGFIFRLLGLPIDIGRPAVAPQADVATGAVFAPGERNEVDRALAWLEGWLILSRQDVASLFQTIIDSRGAGSWNNTYYRDTMALVAPRFGLTPPPPLPSLNEQFEIAAIHERLARMRGVLFNFIGLIIKHVTPGTTSWSAGPARTVVIGDDFFSLPAAGKPRAQLELLLREIIKATPGVSADAVTRYADLVNQIRIHRGEGGP